MSQQINPIAVRDTVLDLSDQVNFAVFRGGESISTQKYVANSATSSQHTYQIQVPSTSTIVSRNLSWTSRIVYTFTGVPAVGEYLVNLAPVNGGTVAGGASWYGADCLAPLPLSQLCTNMSAQINNTNVSCQLQRILDPLLRSVDREMFQQWNKTTPTQLDFYGDYEQALPQKALGGVAGTDVPTAGTSSKALQVPFIPTHNSPFSTYETANLNNDLTSRGSFKINSVVGNTVGDGAAVKTVIVTVDVTEPIFLSPFLFGENVDSPGLSGLTQINFTMNMDASGVRSWRYVNSPNMGAKTLTVSYVQTECYIEAKYYTPKVSDLTPATIVTPLQTFVLNQLPASAPLAVGAGTSLTSNSIQLNSYPDKVFIYIDDAAKYTVATGAGIATNASGGAISDSYATITGINITLNNRSGVLSSYTQQQLYKSSVLSGSKQSWAEFSGLQASYNAANAPDGTPPTYISTCGSVLCLSFGQEIPIPEAYYSPGSLSTAQFQVTVDFKNNTQAAIQPQLNLIFMYSGILSTSNGASSQYVNGVLTKENVLNAAAVPHPINRHNLARFVGSGLLSDLKSIAMSAMPMVKEALAPAVEKLGSMAVDRLARKLRA